MTMSHLAITIRAEDAGSLRDYASISIAFDTAERVDLGASRLRDDPIELQTLSLPTPITKDYDAIAGNHPLDWPARFDVATWLFFAAYRGGLRVGGAVVVAGDPSVDLLEGRGDLAVLWDLRVAVEARGQGVGSALLEIAQAWAWAHDCTTLKVETQDINIGACRLYARHGFHLREANANAYPDLPDEMQLLWDKALVGQPD